MSDNDSFITEVSDELRRDRLFQTIRRYGWIAVAVVLLLVGGAAFNEYRKASARAEAQAFGDAVVAALERETPEARREALLAIDADGTREVLLAMLAADTLGDAGAEAQTAELLDRVADDDGVPQLYRHLAELKSVMLAQGEAEPDALIDRLAPLTSPGAPFRLLGLEQQALAELAKGEADTAIATLQGILGDGQVTRDLQSRARQLIVALGGTLDAS